MYLYNRPFLGARQCADRARTFTVAQYAFVCLCYNRSRSKLAIEFSRSQAFIMKGSLKKLGGAQQGWTPVPATYCSVTVHLGKGKTVTGNIR